MNYLRRVGVGLVWIAVLSGSATAQPLPSCEDQVQALRVFADRLTRSREQGELGAAQTIAALMKRVQELEAEVARLNAAKPKEDKK